MTYVMHTLSDILISARIGDGAALKRVPRSDLDKLIQHAFFINLCWYNIILYM